MTPFRPGLRASSRNCHRVGIERIRLAVKFDQRDAIEVKPAGDRALLLTGLHGLAFFAEADDALSGR